MWDRKAQCSKEEAASGVYIKECKACAKIRHFSSFSVPDLEFRLLQCDSCWPRCSKCKFCLSQWTRSERVLKSDDLRQLSNIKTLYTSAVLQENLFQIRMCLNWELRKARFAVLKLPTNKEIAFKRCIVKWFSYREEYDFKIGFSKVSWLKKFIWVC